MRRILAVTAGLSVIGALVGAVLGILAIAFVGLVTDGPGGILDASVLFGTTALFGALVGSILAPIAAWALMRHVPLWRAILETSVGTMLGVVLGYWLGPVFRFGLFWSVTLGVAGFLCAAVRLRLASQQRATEFDAEAG